MQESGVEQYDWVIVCSNEEPQQHCDGKFPCYIAAFKKWANATKQAAMRLGVWGRDKFTIGVALDSGAGRHTWKSSALHDDGPTIAPSHGLTQTASPAAGFLKRLLTDRDQTRHARRNLPTASGTI